MLTQEGVGNMSAVFIEKDASSILSQKEDKDVLEPLKFKRFARGRD